MTIYWEPTAAARAGLTEDDMLRLSAASERPESQAPSDSGRSTTQILHTRLAIRDVVDRHPALFGKRPDA